jgi:hypothetical protein
MCRSKLTQQELALVLSQLNCLERKVISLGILEWNLGRQLVAQDGVADLTLLRSSTAARSMGFRLLT